MKLPIATFVILLVLIPLSVTPAQADTNSHSISTIPEAIASFGAVVSDGWLYIYSGHIGKAHDHSKDNLSQHFRRMRLASGEWENLPMQTPVQGLALVAHQGMVYRIGGMTAKNSAAEDADLHSTDDFCRYDPLTKQWTKLPSLPKGRSSHDAVVIDNRIYVCGGWELSGEDEGEWHNNALVFDLSKPNEVWESLPEQPFERRALAVSHFDGCLYVIGGMNSDHEIDRSVNVYDPKKKAWMEGPELPGEGMNGFGASAWNDGKRLYVSGSNGIVYRLADDGSAWKEIERLETPRFFHQLVPSDNTILAVGGASMKTGHLNTIEPLDLDRKNVASTTK